MSLKFIVSVLVVLMTYSWLSCSSKESSRDISIDRRVDSEFAKNVEIVQRAIDGKTPMGGEYEAACIFFERLSGISISGSMTFDGLLPDRQSAKDLEKIKEWYKANRKHLCWDEASASVVLCRR